MPYPDNFPRSMDTDNVLLQKIAASTANASPVIPLPVTVVGNSQVLADLDQLVVASTLTATTLNVAALNPSVTQYPISSAAGTGTYIVLGSTNRDNGPVNLKYSPGDVELVTVVTPGTLTNASTGFFGMTITPTAVPLVVTQLGRMRFEGNARFHLLKIVDATTGLDIGGSQILIDMSTGTANAFKYVTLPTPVTLTAGQPFYILSSESSGGDFWQDGVTVTPTAAATVGQRVYNVSEFVTMAGVQRKDVAGTLVDVNGDRTELQVDANGRLRVASAPEFLDTTASAATFATVGVASVLAVVATVARKGLILTNTSANIISLAFGGVAAVANSGIVLYPGDRFEMKQFMFTTANVNAIANVAGSNLAIQQFV